MLLIDIRIFHLIPSRPCSNTWPPLVCYPRGTRVVTNLGCYMGCLEPCLFIKGNPLLGLSGPSISCGPRPPSLSLASFLQLLALPCWSRSRSLLLAAHPVPRCWSRSRFSLLASLPGSRCWSCSQYSLLVSLLASLLILVAGLALCLAPGPCCWSRSSASCMLPSSLLDQLPAPCSVTPCVVIPCVVRRLLLYPSSLLHVVRHLSPRANFLSFHAVLG